jgi:aldehyde dehydrogenase
MDADDEFLDKAIEGVLFALNQGEICTCPSRLLVQEDIADAFIERVIERVKAIKVGNPLDKTVMMGAQASQIQKDKILSYIKLGKKKVQKCL